MRTPSGRLRSFRRRRSLTLSGLAKLLPASASQLNRIENGQCDPGIALAVAIEELTGIRVEGWRSHAALKRLLELRQRRSEAA